MDPLKARVTDILNEGVDHETLLRINDVMQSVAALQMYVNGINGSPELSGDANRLERIVKGLQRKARNLAKRG